MSASAERFEVNPAHPADLAAIERLLVARALPTEGVQAHLSDFLVAGEGGSLLGCAGVERYGPIGLLRSVAVAASFAGRGLGHALVEAVIARAANLGVVTLYLLTTTARGYFSRMGFEVIRRDELPAALGASAELRGACPASAAAMRRVLRAGV
jgi:amino-acid N-acetyltransferase